MTLTTAIIRITTITGPTTITVVTTRMCFGVPSADVIGPCARIPAIKDTTPTGQSLQALQTDYR